MRCRACAVALALTVLVSCGDESGSAGGDLFPDGGRAPEQAAFELAPAAQAAGCRLLTTRSRGEEDTRHTDSAEERVEYRGNPPTLGRHWPPGLQAEDGVYAQSPADEALVHTMEHGRVIFWARPSLPEQARSTLRALFDEDSYQLVVVPRRNMPYAVAATAWNGDPGPGGTGRTLGCKRWSEAVIDALRAFRDEHRSRGPEPVP
jgi:hypothetical protein